EEGENPLLRIGRILYRDLLGVLLPLRWVVAPAVMVAFGGVIFWLFQNMGVEFLPNLDEGVIAMRANFPEGTSLEQTAKYANQIRAILREFDDVAKVSSRAGRTDSGLDPFPPNRIELQVHPKPYGTWTQLRTKAELLAAMGQRVRSEFPTTRFVFTQPIIDNVVEETNGTSADLAIELTGRDPAVLQALGEKTLQVLKQVPGAVDVAIE